MIAAFSLGFFIIPAFAEEEFVEKPNYWASGKGDAMLFDLILLRPVGVASIVVGFTATIAGFPFSVIGNNSREVGDALLGEPVNFTFVRPLGEVFPTQEYLRR